MASLRQAVSMPITGTRKRVDSTAVPVAPRKAATTPRLCHEARCMLAHCTLIITACLTANLRTKFLDFRGLDPSMILSLRGGILMSIGNSPEIMCQRILVGIILVGRLGVLRAVRAHTYRYARYCHGIQWLSPSPHTCVIVHVSSNAMPCYVLRWCTVYLRFAPLAPMNTTYNVMSTPTAQSGETE